MVNKEACEMSKNKKVLGIITLCLSCLTLTSCDEAQLSEKIGTTIANMLPNLYITLMQLALFILVAVLFIWLAYKPLKKKLKQRSDYIEKNIKDSEVNKNIAEQNAIKSNQMIIDSQKRAGEIIANAQKVAENKASTLQHELSESIEKQKTQATKDIEDQKRKMISDAKSEIVEAAIETSKEILGREVKKEDNDKFVDDFLKEFEKEKKN